MDAAEQGGDKASQADGRVTPTLPSIVAKINHARRELLDLSTRNRLLSSPRRSKRAKTIELVDELCDEVYRILVTEERSMTFLPRPTTEAGGGDDEESQTAEAIRTESQPPLILAMPPDEDEDTELAARHTDTRLQTVLEGPLLQKRQLALHYDGRTALDEQGFNILYLAIGFLKWVDPNQKKDRFAPLILVPITLERTSAQARFKVKYSGDEISTNLSLKEKLQSTFTIDLPLLPEAEDLVPSEYCGEIAERISKTADWEVFTKRNGRWHFLVLEITDATSRRADRRSITICGSGA